ncbi:hypothetical protein PInf_013144 [Phytophthora infestans]|nr:hypothetical protein PInf_013144 [Phytophthora infestans]
MSFAAWRRQRLPSNASAWLRLRPTSASMAAPQATRPKLVWLKVPAFEGMEGENLHFWVREVEIAMKRLCEQLRAVFLPANNEFRQRSRFLACKQGKCELQEYVQEMRTLVASLAGNPLPEDIKTTVFMDGLKVPVRTSFSGHKQAGTPREEERRHDVDGVPREAEHRSNDAVAPVVTQPVDTGAYSEPEPMDLSSAESLVR